MLNLQIAEELYLPPDIDQYLEESTSRKEAKHRKGAKQRKIACTSYVWPVSTPLVAAVIGKLLGGSVPADSEILGLDPQQRAVAKYLSRVEPVQDRYFALLSYPVAVIDTIRPHWTPSVWAEGVPPPPGYRWRAPADPVKVAIVDRILEGLPPQAKEPEWAPKAPKPTAVITQSGTPTWAPELPKHHAWRGQVDFEAAARQFDLARYLSLGENGGKILCPAHPDTRLSLSIYPAHGRWFYRCWSCGVHGDSISYTLRGQ
jgi:hypothetical protein